MALQAGWLRGRIKVYRPGEVDDGLTSDAPGEPLLVADVATSAEPVSDGERARAGQTQAALTMRFLVRNSAATRLIDAQCYAEHKGERYGLAGAKEALRWKGVALAPGEAIELSALAIVDGAT